MSLLQECSDDLERVQAVGQREGKAKEMQKLREKVHSQGEELMTCDGVRPSFCWDDPGMPLRNMGLVKDLRGFEKATQERLAELEKEPEPDDNLIIQERAMLEAICKEIQRLERQSFYSQLGID